MKPSFSIGAKNGLLEQKHFDQMGMAIWLYLWFIDKQPKNTNKVSGGAPVTYQTVKNSLGITHRTYTRWLQILKDGGYIAVQQTRLGLIIEIEKAKKWDARVANNGHSKNLRVDKNVTKGRQKWPSRVDKNGASNIKETKLQETITNNNTYTANKSPEHEAISKTYYQAIKTLGLPVRNHKTLQSKIKAMLTETDPAKTIIYLEWIRDNYDRTDWDFKPHLNEALDIHAKRVQIENSLKAAAKEQAANKVFRI
jgi:hypothetical protein